MKKLITLLAILSVMGFVIAGCGPKSDTGATTGSGDATTAPADNSGSGDMGSKSDDTSATTGGDSSATTGGDSSATTGGSSDSGN
ncbi:MAG TPA: hypothetical protein VNI20_13665 [Fimbriimonadaceae bacterium]|nr:hypothetical protein [Fimbriimonadaceae bacterium]